jgi:TRAP-type C4-dicarboxylate transport system permease small subunit
MNRLIVRITRFVNKTEDWLLVSMLATLVVLSVVQIVYRNVFGGGIAWIDPFLRMLVLWVALSGAMIASRNNNHIRIDLFVRNLSESRYRIVQRIVYAYCCLICGVIAYHSARFVQMDYQFGVEAFSGIPAWFTEVIIPFSFLMMALRYILLFISPPASKR